MCVGGGDVGILDMNKGDAYNKFRMNEDCTYISVVLKIYRMTMQLQCPVHKENLWFNFNMFKRPILQHQHVF